MSEPQTVNTGLIVPNTGDLVGTWGSTALNPDFVTLDGYLGGVQTISVSNAPITLTAPAGFTATPSGGPVQSQNMALKFTGALTSNVTVTLPLPGMHIIHNLTSLGSFALIFAAAGAGQVISTSPGSAQRIYNDGTNVYFVDLPMIGSFLDLYSSATLPPWIANCTVAPYLYCNGSTFNATTFPYLNAILGGNTLPDLRGRGRSAFNDGTNRVTTAGSGVNGDLIGSSGGQQTITIVQANLPNYNMPVGINDPGHVHPTQGNPENSGTNLGQVNLVPIGGGSGVTGMGAAVTNISTSGANLGGSSTPLTNMPPVLISGITLIRSG